MSILISLGNNSLLCDVEQKEGVSSLGRLVLFTSEEAHYSIVKMAALEGIGSDNVILIRTDADGKMNVDHLREEVARVRAEGAIPFMVSATAGTPNSTVLASSSNPARLLLDRLTVC